jgi:Tol biopolymer transport system component
MRPDGSRIKRLTFHTGIDSYPALDPNGEKIAFVSDRDGNNEIYTMGVDGSNVTRLTTNAVSDLGPAWSPAGDAIAFAREVLDIGGSRYQLFVMEDDGTNEQPLQSTPDDDQDPSWSPDGTKIVFEKGSWEGTALFVVGSGGSGEYQLTPFGTDADPMWCTARAIIFARYTRNPSYFGTDLIVVDPDGISTRRITDARRNKDGGEPSCSSSGRRIAFSSFRYHNPEVLSGRLDLSGRPRILDTRRLTKSPRNDTSPSLP